MTESLEAMVGKDFTQCSRQVCEEMECFQVGDTQPLLSALIGLLVNADRLARSSIRFSDLDFDDTAELPVTLAMIPEGVSFHIVFDPLDQNSVCATSLKDALADIYRSLKSGLSMLDRDPSTSAAVLWQWKLDYETHWGRHLLDVIRFLFISPRDLGCLSGTG